MGQEQHRASPLAVREQMFLRPGGYRKSLIRAQLKIMPSYLQQTTMILEGV
jgi:hypothetical protein